NQRTTQVRREAVPSCRVEDHVCPVERGTQHRGLGNLAAVSATDAAIVDRGYRIILEGVIDMLERKRWTAGQTDAGLASRTNVVVHAESFLDRALAGIDEPGELRPYATLFVQHAFRGGDHDLGTGLSRGQRLAKRIAKASHVVGAIDLPDPRHAKTLH